MPKIGMHKHCIADCCLVKNHTTTRVQNYEPTTTRLERYEPGRPFRQCSQAQPTKCRQPLRSSVMEDHCSLTWATNCIWAIGKEAQPNHLNTKPVQIAQVSISTCIQLTTLRLSLITPFRSCERPARGVVPWNFAQRTWAVLHPVKGGKLLASAQEIEPREEFLSFYQQFPRAKGFQLDSLGCGLRLPCLGRPVHKPHWIAAVRRSPRTSAC